MLKFEVQICLENLPKHFDELENFILSPWYTSIVKDQQALDYEQKRYKIVQEAKRTWLNIYIHSYELQYQEYNYQYQMELDKLKSLFSLTSTTSQMNLFDTFQSYMNHRINRIKQEIYREKIPIYRKKLVHRQRHQRSRSTSKKIMRIHVAPKIIMDVFRHPFTSREIAFLSRGQYIFSSEILYIKSNDIIYCLFVCLFLFRSNLRSTKSKCTSSNSSTRKTD